MIRTIFFDFGNVVGFFDHQRAIARLSHYTDMAPTELGLILYAGPLEADYEAGKISTAEYIAAARADGRLRCTDGEFVAAYTDIFWPNRVITCARSGTQALSTHFWPATPTKPISVICRNSSRMPCYRFHHLVASHEAKSRKPHRNFSLLSDSSPDVARKNASSLTIYHPTSRGQRVWLAWDRL